jgi:hypothetical protein
LFGKRKGFQVYAFKVLVCGGRDFTGDVSHILDDVNARHGIDLIIHGGAKGADSLAEQWAFRREIDCLRVPAKWKRHGKAAGPMRNTEMLKLKPNLVVAFPGGKGTENMVKQAKVAGISVI